MLLNIWVWSCQCLLKIRYWFFGCYCCLPELFLWVCFCFCCLLSNSLFLFWENLLLCMVSVGLSAPSFSMETEGGRNGIFLPRALTLEVVSLKPGTLSSIMGICSSIPHRWRCSILIKNSHCTLWFFACLFLFLFIWLRRVVAAACGIFIEACRLSGWGPWAQ